jgi:selT/selW/selH-like putative selenoprotein
MSALQVISRLAYSQYRRSVNELKQFYPDLKIEGGPYTPPPSVQYAVRGLRFAQVGVAALFFLGEPIFGYFGRRPPQLVAQMHENKLITAAGVYGLDVVAQTMKAINAFEITYNGNVLHSKLKSGNFPKPGELSERLAAVMKKEKAATGAASAPAA